jgi:HlyD family secretion protein
MKKAFLIAGVIIVLLVAGAFLFLRGNGGEPKFKTEKVSKGDIVMTVTATGTVNAVITVQVGTQVSGTIKKLYVDFNSHVKKGQLIAQIDPALFEEQVAQSNANLLSARANLEKAEASLVDAKRTRDRNKELVSKGLIAQSDFDTSDTNYETAKAGVSASKAAVAQSEAALKNAKTNLGYTRIVSPVDGTVVSRNVDVGQTVAASFQTPTLFTIAQDLTKMQIDTSVDEADIGRVKLGDDVDFTVDAYPDVTFKGKVGQVRIAPITVQNVVTYDVVVMVDNPELKLKPGMTANVSIIVAQKKDVLKVPNAALRFRPAVKEGGQPRKRQSSARGGGGSIYILAGDKPERIPITLGISDGNFTEVAGGDLKEGQEVIVEALGKQKNQSAGGPPRMHF